MFRINWTHRSDKVRLSDHPELITIGRIVELTNNLTNDVKKIINMTDYNMLMYGIEYGDKFSIDGHEEVRFNIIHVIQIRGPINKGKNEVFFVPKEALITLK